MNFKGGMTVGPLRGEVTIPTPSHPRFITIEAMPKLFNCAPALAGARVIRVADDSFTFAVNCDTVAEIRWSFVAND